MLPYIKPLSVLTAFVLDVAVAAAASIATVAAAEDPHLAPSNTWVPIGVFASALLILVPLIWWAGRTFQKVCDDLAFVKRRLRELPCIPTGKPCKPSEEES